MKLGKISLAALVLLSATFFGGADAKADNSGVLDVDSMLNSNPSEDTVRIVKAPGYSEAFVPGEDHVSSPIMSGQHNISSYVDGYDTYIDKRPEDTNCPIHFKLFYNGTIAEGEEPNIVLEVSFPFAPDNLFGDRGMIFQQEDSNGNNEPNGYRGDVRAEIDYGEGLAGIDFGKLPAGTYTPGTPFLHLRIDFDKLLADLNGDGEVNLKDYAIMAKYYGKEGRHIADISGPNDVPDKNVDYWDLSAFCDDYLKEE